MENQVKTIISELFGVAPSIGEIERVQFQTLENEKDTYIVVSVDGVPYAKVSSGRQIQYHPKGQELRYKILGEKLFLFRCSSVGKLMTNARGKSNLDKYQDTLIELEKKQVQLAGYSENAKVMREKTQKAIDKLEQDLKALKQIKDEVILSETCKNEIRDLWVENGLGRRREFYSEMTEKGTTQEAESIRLLSEYDRHDYEKNEDRQIDTALRLSGEMDIKRTHENGEIEIIDIKSRYDAQSFFANDTDEQKQSEADQLDAYLLLNPEATKATIANVLTNGSDDAIRRKVYLSSLKHENGEMPNSETIKIIKEQVFDFENFKRLTKEICGDISNDAEALEQYEAFREIPLKMRVIKITRERDEERLNEMKKRLIECLNYAKEKYNVF